MDARTQQSDLPNKYPPFFDVLNSKKPYIFQSIVSFNRRTILGNKFLIREPSQ